MFLSTCRATVLLLVRSEWSTSHQVNETVKIYDASRQTLFVHADMLRQVSEPDGVMAVGD